MGAVIVALIPLNTPLWSIIHEAIHRNFHPDRMINENAGRCLAIVFGASFHVLRFGHLMHHQFNRAWESEFYRPDRVTPIAAWAGHYFKILGGLYLTEVFTSFVIALLPLRLTLKLGPRIFPDVRQHRAIANLLVKDGTIEKIRTDCALIAALYILAFAAYGNAWPALLLLLGGRALIISLMDNAYHYGTPLDNSVTAKELKAAPWIERFILSFNYHQTHHENPHLPWIKLSSYHQAHNRPFSGNLIQSLLIQFKGPMKLIPSSRAFMNWDCKDHPVPASASRRGQDHPSESYNAH